MEPLSILMRLFNQGRTDNPVTVDGRIHLSGNQVESGNQALDTPAIGWMLTLGSVPPP